MFAKALGFQVVASDAAERAAVVARALIANSSVRLRREDALGLFREPRHDGAAVAARHVGRAFTSEQAEWIDRALAHARWHGEPRRSLLQLLVVKLLLRLYPMSLPSATDAAAAAQGDFDRVSPRRLGHYLRARQQLTLSAVWKVAQDVNAGVFGGRGTAQRGDAREVIAATEADILYLDPPYAGTTRYENAYAVIDELLDDRPPAGRAPTLDQLLTAADHVPLVVLSYGGPTTTLTDLEAQVERHRPVLRALAVPYAHLRSIATKEKTDGNHEFLIVAGR